MVRLAFVAVVFVLVVPISVTAYEAHYAKTYDGTLLPDPFTTPGKVALTDTATVCATK